MEIKFFGTGTPLPSQNRCGQGIMISHEQTNILFDCGPGVNRRIIESGVKHNKINHLFISHLHWDHFGDYDALAQSGFLFEDAVPLQVYGPIGTQEITDFLFKKVYFRDLVYRRGNRGSGSESYREPLVKEIFGGLQLKIGPFLIKTFRVHHGEFVDYSFAFRIECEGRTVVISGDTSPVFGFEEFAKECDVLIHEVMANKPTSSLRKARPELNTEQILNMMGHTSPHQVGVIARQANAGKLVLTHLLPTIPDNLVDMVAEEFSGSIEIAEDLMEIFV